ncbi:uncharacterized protein PAC_14367 [Phialocephala subalpina]|uniref:Heterokaryon incompatibility domain-containing protein n=1 Tax=Phialocephala subalpina TaxID=576137 RepID=A0A1L7XHF0_9HELO|nr:uncharacterized protein PAC_14367 [Phialocephala subalpina]
MKDIYSLTKRVVVWLGEDNGQAAEAIAIIKKTANYCAFEMKIPLRKIGAELFNLEIERKTRLSEGRVGKDKIRGFEERTPLNESKTPSPWNAVAWFYNREWFKRVWIVQEVAFSPAVMCIGSVEVDFRSVAIASEWLLRKDYCYTTAMLYALHEARSIFFTGLHLNSPIATLIESASGAKATDPRDKVFGLLGLASNRTRTNPFMRSDYTKPLCQVYIDTLRHIIEVNEDRGTLSDVFPTSRHIKPWLAGRGRTQVVEQQSIKSGVLSLKGVMIGTLKWTDDALLDDANMDYLTIQKLWNRTCEALEVLYPVDALKTKFAQTITAGQTPDFFGSPRLFDANDLDNYIAVVDDLAAAKKGEVALAGNFARLTLLHAFFTTVEGHLGLTGSQCVRMGDIICAFFGHMMPYILRPVGEQYRFLGPCYLHGFMYGEAVKELDSGKQEEQWFHLC